MQPKNTKVKISLTWKLAAIFSIVFAGVFFLTLEGITYRITEKADLQVMTDLSQVLEGAAKSVDVDTLLELAREGRPNEQGLSDDPRYIALLEWLDSVHSIEPDAWPYLYIPAEKEGYVYFVADLYALYDINSATKFMELYKSNSGYILVGLEHQTFRAVDSWLVAKVKRLATSIEDKSGSQDSKLASMLRHLADWLAQTSWFAPRPFGTYQDQYGRWASGYMPVENSAGEKVAGIGVDFRADMIDQIRKQVRTTVEYSFIVSYLVMLPLVILVSVKLTRPIAALTGIATRIGQNHNHHLILPTPSEKQLRDEIDVLELVLFNTYTKLQNANQQLQGLSHQLISDREQYRKELARDLHDNVLSYLSVLSSTQPGDLDPEAMQENYKQVIARLRATIFSLRSPMMEYGLSMAVEDFIDHYKTQSAEQKANVTVMVPPSEARFDNTTETHIFRIIQQAFENAVEHSNASEIRITGTISEDLIDISIEDNGEGIEESNQNEIDLDRYEARRKYGMVGMIERASLIGAELEILSGEVGGTVVHLYWKP